MSKSKTFARGAIRMWAGTSLLAALAFVVTIPLFQTKAPVWVWVIAGVILVLAIVLTCPVTVRTVGASTTAPVAPQSSFIRGDVRNSTIARVDSDAHTFIDGNVEDARIFDIVFRGRKRA